MLARKILITGCSISTNPKALFMDKPKTTYTLYGDLRNIITKLYYQKKYNLIALIVFVITLGFIINYFIVPFQQKDERGYNEVSMVEAAPKDRSTIRKKILINFNPAKNSYKLYMVQVFSATSYGSALEAKNNLEYSGYRAIIIDDIPLYRVYLDKPYNLYRGALTALNSFRNDYDPMFIRRNKPFVREF